MDQPLLNCVVTADYEVFLGRNFLSYDEVLFEPTQHLLDLCGRLDVPVTFFADVCSVWAHRMHEEFSGYVSTFESQMKTAVTSGHDVQLHLHPHWLKSTYSNGTWQVSTDQMYLHELGYEEGDNSADAVIRAGIDYLDKLLRPVKAGYNCRAFRAAGLALQPDEDKLIAALLKNGIAVDSSIAQNICLKTDTIEIDYSDTGADANWYMTPDSGLRASTDDGLYEVPIATFQTGLTNRLGFLWRRAWSISMRRGASISRAERQTRLANMISLLRYNWRYVSTNPWYLFSCDTKGLNKEILLDGIDAYIERHKGADCISFSMINHPKMMFQRQFDLLGDVIEGMRKRYKDRLKFVTFAETLTYARRKAP